MSTTGTITGSIEACIFGYIEDNIGTHAMDLQMYPNQIYENLILALRMKYQDTIYTIPTKHTIVMKIQKIRGQNLVKDIYQISMPPHSTLTNRLPMLRRHWFGDIDGVYHQTLIWTTDECLTLLRYNGPAFIDATFRITPAPFMQCLIIMVYDIGTQLYIPCVYALTTTKNEYMYCTILHEIVVLSKYMWMPSSIVVDFEQALINACKYEFKESIMIGCYFHMKQALYRKLKKIN